jgi:hypothetical protein
VRIATTLHNRKNGIEKQVIGIGTVASMQVSCKPTATMFQQFASFLHAMFGVRKHLDNMKVVADAATENDKKTVEATKVNITTLKYIDL